jgi:hypothetical protein
LIAKLDALWLSGMIPDNEYSRILYEWKRRILKMASNAKGIIRQAMIHSRKKAQQGSVDHNPLDDNTLDQTISDGMPVSADKSDNQEIPATTREIPKNSSGLFGWIS